MTETSGKQTWFDPAHWTLANWQFASVMLALIVALGLFALTMIARTENPVVDSPQFSITAVLPGASPLSIEEQLTKPVENAVYRLDGVERVRSYSRNDVAVLDVKFRWGTNVDNAYGELQREMNALRPGLPPGLIRLDVIRYRSGNVATRVVALCSDTLPMRGLDKLARRLRDHLGAIPGVREVKITGVAPSKVSVELDWARLAALGIAPARVVGALHDAGADGPIGTLDAGVRRFDVTYEGAYPSLEAIRKVALPVEGGAVVRVGDIANVGWADADVAEKARFNGHRAVLLGIQAAEGQDVGQLAPALDAALGQFRQSLPGGVKLELGFDQWVNVADRIGHLEKDFVLALVLVCVILLPIGWRAGLVVMLAIPLSLLIGVMALFALGFTLNQLSIAGLVLSLGILVDDAIVVVENIVRWRRDGHDSTAAVVGATRQIAVAILGCTACLIFAFLPLSMLPEVSGAFIRSLPVAVFASVTGSLLVAFTVIPLAARLAFRDEPGVEGSPLLQRVNIGIQRVYAPMLRRALDAPKTWLIGLYALSLLAIPMVMVIGTSLFPEAGLPEFLINVNTGQGATLAHTEALADKVEARARAIPGVRWVSTSIGRTGPRLYYNLNVTENDPSFAQVAVGLGDMSGRQRAALMVDLRREFTRITGADIAIVDFKEGSLIEAPVAIRVSGTDIVSLTRLAGQAEAILKATPGLIDVKNPLRRQRIDIHLVADDAAVAAHGVAPGAVRQALQIDLAGAEPANLRDSDGDTWPLHVSLPRGSADGGNRLLDLAKVYVPTVSGGQVKLSALAHATFVTGPASVDRVDRIRTVTLTANVAPGVLVGRATDDALARLRAVLALPPGYRLSLGGEAEEQGKSFGNLGPALLVAAMGILAVLVLEFGKLRSVAVVFGIVPFGFLGAVLALLVTGNSLSFTAMVGMVALIGIEVKNSILLVDFTEQLRGEGVRIRDAVERAGELRFLPVLLTSLTAIGGFLPLAIEGNGLYSPVAIVLIGGLISSTLLARLATPAMYLLLARGGEE